MYNIREYGSTLNGRFPPFQLNWVSEASLTLGCAIEISRDICMSVCLKDTNTKNTYSKNTWAKSKVTRTHMPVNKEEIF